MLLPHGRRGRSMCWPPHFLSTREKHKDEEAKRNEAPSEMIKRIERALHSVGLAGPNSLWRLMNQPVWRQWVSDGRGTPPVCGAFPQRRLHGSPRAASMVRPSFARLENDSPHCLDCFGISNFFSLFFFGPIFLNTNTF